MALLGIFFNAVNHLCDVNKFNRFTFQKTTDVKTENEKNSSMRP